ncbi:unnamed protein product [Parnassius apollo]|uniref:(apollo) hypothetical protein n=1 Tax=Parnassius apollo TaxID=110799 RepID=A0A8S3YG68_PARAO|nr:unnamed protein product [Parnassius apollo]
MSSRPPKRMPVSVAPRPRRIQPMRRAATMNKFDTTKRVVPAATFIPPKRVAIAKKTALVKNTVTTMKTSDRSVESKKVPKKETKIVEKEKEKPKPKTEDYKLKPTAEGHYELSPEMSRALDSELEHIMIKVWQEFPDDPTTDEEKLVSEKFRNEAGDDLRNILGLSVTKRLVNLHGSLFVKIQFMKRPERGSLREFIKKYNFITFKRIDNGVNMFVAQLSNIVDFDRLCAPKHVYCGRDRVKVTPCYSFTYCPPNLRTIFSDRYVDEEKSKNIGAAENKTEATEQTAEHNKTAETNTNAKEEKIEANENKSSNTKTSDVKTETVIKATEIISHPKDDIKTMENLKTSSKEMIESKSEYTQDKSKSIPNKPKAKEPSSSNDSKEQTIKKPNLKQPVLTTKEVKENKNIDLKKNLDAFMDFNEEDQEVISEYKYDDDEELDDKDILALISEGIVLDECSGSEVE